jgi:YjbE family integral membrane protein
MELIVSTAFWLGLLKIIWVNILLSGDNAVVIALASRALPPSQQKQAILWGSVAAIIMRVILTIFAVQLLQLAWLKAIGAVLLVWIGVQLLADDDDEGKVEEASSLFSAIKTILIADLVMSLDNVLAVAAAADAGPAEAKIPLLVLGLALSIPIVIFGSSIVLKLMERFPVIITLGAMLLGWIAGEMLAKEEFVAAYVHGSEVLHWILSAAGALLVLAIGKVKARRTQATSLPVAEDKESLAR